MWFYRYSKGMESLDYKQYALAVIGNLFITLWGIWSIHTHGVAFYDFSGYVNALIGLGG